MCLFLDAGSLVSMVLKEGRLICSNGPKTLKVTNDALLPTVSFPIDLVTWGNWVNRWELQKTTVIAK